MNIHCHNHKFNTALRAILKPESATHILILAGAFHRNGTLYFNEFLKMSTRVAYGNVTKLVDVEFLLSLVATSLQIVVKQK